MIRGLVIGKFYPPHRGHNFLVDTGLAQTDELHVIVCRRPEETPSADVRAEWLREIHPTALVRVEDDTLDPDDSQAWAEACVRWLGFTPDVVFTSEDYGHRFARFLGCRHALVDQSRSTIPTSGTAVRTDPLRCWDYLAPPVRAFYAKRVCLVGAESTGKTTLTQQLAEHYRTAWVPEYGREYSERILAENGAYHWTSEDFVHIAQTQCELEERLAREANRLLICDTDAFATAIWHRRYMGFRCPEVEAIAAEHRRPDLYLIPDVDTPFVQDGTRDGEAIREWMHAEFLAELETRGVPYRVLAGSFEERFGEAVAVIDAVVGRGTSHRGTERRMREGEE